MIFSLVAMTGLEKCWSISAVAISLRWASHSPWASCLQSYLPSTYLYFSFRTIIWVNLNGFLPYLICALILWRSGLGLLIDKFRQFLIELSAFDMIMAGIIVSWYVPKNCLMSDKLCRPWSKALFCSIWSSLHCLFRPFLPNIKGREHIYFRVNMVICISQSLNFTLLQRSGSKQVSVWM